jgi:hypothetical protein
LCLRGLYSILQDFEPGKNTLWKPLK